MLRQTLAHGAVVVCVEALEELSKDELIKSVLGEGLFKRYYDIKMAEWDEFRIHVTDWEKERYMEVY